MSPFEEFSAEIQRIAEYHAKSMLIRLILRAEYVWRKYWKNEPLPFAFVGMVDGRAIGNTIDIHHLRLPDMMEHEARGQLTAKVLLGGLRVNAFSMVRSEGVGMQGKTTIQPCWFCPPSTQSD